MAHTTLLKNQAYRGSSSRTVYHGGDKDVPGLRRYRPDTVPVEKRLLPASSRFTTVFDSLPGYSRWVPVVSKTTEDMSRFNTVHPGSPRLSTVPPRLWHGSSRIIQPGLTRTLNRDSENGALHNCVHIFDIAYLLVWYQSTIIPVILDRGRRFLDMFKTLCPAHFHAFHSHDHFRSIKTNVRQSCTLFLQFYTVYLWKHQKAFKNMYTSAATIYCRTRFMKMLKDFSGFYFVNIAVPNHKDLSRARMRSTCDFTTWLVLHRSQHGPKPSCDRGFTYWSIKHFSLNILWLFAYC